MTTIGKGPQGQIMSPEKGDYPMTVRKICVEPGQRVKEGDCIAQLLEPSGRWVSLVSAACGGKIKTIHAREGGLVDRPLVLCDFLAARRPTVGEKNTLSVISRISLDDLLARETTEDAQAAPPRPVRPIEIIGHSASARPAPKSRTQLNLAKASMAIVASGVLLAAIATLGPALYQRATQAPDVSMDTLWAEMRASRIAASEAFNADANDDISQRAASQQRADSAALRYGSRSTACNGLFIGQELPGVHVTRGVRKITYLDPGRGVGAFIWSRNQESEAFACARIRRH